MTSHGLRLLACLSLATLAWSQKIGTPEYEAEARRGYDALVAGRNDEGIAIFERLFAANPTDSVSAYNVACGHAKKKELDPAFEWLAKAVELGFGTQPSPTSIDNVTWAAEKDADLEPLRLDPRFAPLVERMRTLKKALDEYVDAPAIHVPDALRDVEVVPLLVVLHDAGSSKDAVVSGWWRSVADELGFALVAPSASIPLGAKPADGLRWFDDLEGYASRAWLYERPVVAALAAFEKERKVDRSCVYVAGSGQGATVALGIAFASPAQYRGVLALNGSVADKLVHAKVAEAKKQGIEARFLLFDEPAAAAPARDLAREALVLAGKLEVWGLRGGAEALEPPIEGGALATKVAATLRAMVLAPRQTEK